MAKDVNKYLVARRPWLADEAVAELRKLVTADTRVFEWGSGGSTLFFLDQGAHVVSVEHHADWSKKVAEFVVAGDDGTHMARAALHCIAPNAKAPPGSDPCNYLKCTSSDKREYRAYCEHILQYAPDSFDLVLVDGRARPACVWLAVPRVAPGGIIVLDDCQRTRYQPVQQALRTLEWEAMHLFPEHGDVGKGRRVAFWRKPTKGGT